MVKINVRRVWNEQNFSYYLPNDKSINIKEINIILYDLLVFL